MPRVSVDASSTGTAARARVCALRNLSPTPSITIPINIYYPAHTRKRQRSLFRVSVTLTSRPALSKVPAWPTTTPSSHPTHVQTPRRHQAGWQRFPLQPSTEVRISARPYPTAPQRLLWALHRRDIMQYSRPKSPLFVSPSLSLRIRDNYLRWRTMLPTRMVDHSCTTRSRKKVSGQTWTQVRGLLKLASIMAVRQATLTLRLTGGSLAVPSQPGEILKAAGSMSLLDVPLPSMGGTNRRRYNGGMNKFALTAPALAMVFYHPYSPTGFITLSIRSSLLL